MNGAPDRNTFPLTWVGADVAHAPVNVVVAAEAEVAGSNVMVVSGTGTVVGTPSTRKVTFWFATWTVVACPAGRPETLVTLLNQRESPAGMAVPLKFETIDE
jgi:hypothetical protein